MAYGTVAYGAVEIAGALPTSQGQDVITLTGGYKAQ